MNIAFAEWNTFHHIHTHHHHAGNPEKDDVKTGNQYRGWIEGIQKFSFIRPA